MASQPGPSIPTVAETLKHPAYSTAIWKLEPDKKGLASVAEGRGGPFNISWEIHGEGPIKLIFIMGLGGLKSAWQRQTLYFGHQNRHKYSVLILDNRGVGDSDKPLMRYSTSEMALDIAELLASPEIQWIPSYPLPTSFSPSSKLHITGISLGGMISQELALLIPQAVSSLNLCCTAAHIENTTTFTENMANRASMLIPKSLDKSVGDAARSIFAHSWLYAKDDTELPNPKTTPKVLPPFPSDPEIKYQHFDSNAQRFVAQEMHKRLDPTRFGLKGFLLQLIAAGWHHKSEAQMKELGDLVGRERIMVMHGTEDRMISPPHGHKLIKYLQPAAGIIVEGMGHAPSVERTEWFHKVLEERIDVGERLDKVK
ncbi:hypothetical protein QBC38DRAFT_196148 [Podospora fimiseda]|uniref:AB hydrolase-1 domain-containing protein n=1 Tax=Podospora fimiseda TaxID=252190 RepID=A0AAN7BPV2_9PEZI|nr:hypothetical protein QBC38DRAFT_196148 [Podospora fimiseda]